MKKQTLIFAIALIVIMLVSYAVAKVLYEKYVIPTSGTLNAVDISVTWLDGSNVTFIDWGNVDNDTEVSSAPLNITNVKTVPFTLDMNASNLSPSILSLTLTWNYTGSTLGPSDFVIVVLNQTVTASTTDFSYDVDIYAIAT